jgi:hypothetical protein
VLKRYDLLQEMLVSLQSSSVMPDAVYIINNGMDKDKAQDLMGIVPHTVIINPNRPLGVAESWNWFIQNVPEERVITNDDIQFAPGSLAAMIAQPESFVSCTFGFSCFLIRDACVDKVGLFDEEISPGYGYFEDMDYLRRMRQAGVEDSVVQCGVVHRQSSTPQAYTFREIERHNQLFLRAQDNFKRKWNLDPSWSQLAAVGGQGHHAD